jgi:enterochelin esterase-like enzyme
LSSQGFALVVGVLSLFLLADVALVLLQSARPVDSATYSVANVTVSIVATTVPTTAPTTHSQPAGATPTRAPSTSVASATQRLASTRIVANVTPTPPSTATPAENEASSSVQPIAAANVDLCDTPIGQLVTETMQSKVLGMALPVHVYLPPCYNANRYSYPTLYLIQGSGYEMGEWIDDGVMRIADIQMSLGLLSPFIIIMPASDLRAGNGSRYLYSTGGKNSWEDFIVNELVPMIDSTYSTSRERDGRAIGGISRGAYWALQISFANPDKFSAVGAHSPSITPDQLIGTPANFSMLSLAKSISDVNSLRIFMDAGDMDWAQSGVNKLSQDLDAKHITYTATSGEGGHSDDYWASRMSDYLAFYATNWPRTARAKPDSMGSTIDSSRTQP